jgi:hypothetical protein
MWIIAYMAVHLDGLHRRRLILSGAVLGAIIGLLGFWLKARAGLDPDTGSTTESVSAVVVRLANSIRSFGAVTTLLIVVAVPFLATLILMPRFLRWLESRADRSQRPFYLQAAAGGIAFGTLATALIASGLMLAGMIAGSFTDAAKTAGDSGAALFFAGLIFVPIMGFFAPFYFFPFIVAAGIPFGAFFGGLVRRFGRERQEQPLAAPGRRRGE